MLIDIRDLYKIYNEGKESEVRALDGVTLQIDRGEFVAIVGQSGSGKSTLMNVLGCLDIPTYGEYYLNGTDVTSLSDKQLAHIRNKEIGFIFQGYNLIQELDALEQERKRLDRQLGVGFQWSFSQTMGRLKEDILAGVYGRPKMLKTFISWPRALSYYGSSTWKGRVRDGKGGYILDSIVTNAAAHYLHNIFFLLGSTMETAAYPERVEAELYRAKQIESFDTCILRGCAGGGRFLYVASHATQLNLEPSFCYEFEKGAVVFNQDAQDNCVTGRLSDGRTIVLNAPDAASTQELYQSLLEKTGLG